MPVVRMLEEVEYERRLMTMVGRWSRDAATRPRELELDLVCFDYEYDQLWFVHSRRADYIWQDVAFEERMRRGTNAIPGCFVGWQCVEVWLYVRSIGRSFTWSCRRRGTHWRRAD